MSCVIPETFNKENLIQFLLKEHHKDIMAILQAENLELHYSIEVHFLTLMDEFPEYCEILLKDSFRYFPIYDEVCVQAAQTLYEQRKSVPMSESDSQSNDDLDNTLDILIHLSHQNQFTIPPNVDQLSHKKNIHFRIRGIPTEDYSIPRLSNKDQLISVKGIVVRCTEKKIIEYQQQFQCKLCEHVFMVKAEYDQHYTIPQPTEPCSNTNEMNLQCNSTQFRLLKRNKGETLRDPKDFQEIKIQESYGKHTKRTIPCNMWVTLEDDLVDQCKPGDEVIIAGTVRQRWPVSFPRNERSLLELVIKGNNLHVLNHERMNDDHTKNHSNEEYTRFWQTHKEEPLIGREIILRSFCPQIYGQYFVKLAAIIVLAGGVRRTDESGTKARGESHLLLVGDPGTGKSNILKYISKLSPRSVLTSGIRSTNAGLTVSATKSKESGQWQLEAGALVLADGGVCCIDDFTAMSEKDTNSILEAMEQQTISVSKAGMVCKLNTRASVIATSNAKNGRYYNIDGSLQENTGLKSPHLSRFDLILLLIDEKNNGSCWDDEISGFILNNYELEGVTKVQREFNRFDHEPNETNPIEPVSTNVSDISTHWSFEKLKTYLVFIKQLKPSMNPSAEAILSQYFYIQRQKSHGLRDQSQITIRMLESLIRLAQGHAKIMFRDKVTILDAIEVILLMDMTMPLKNKLFETSGNSPVGCSNPSAQNNDETFQCESLLQSNFPDNILRNHQTSCEMVFKRLGLVHSDILAMDELKSHNHTQCSGADSDDNESDIEKRHQSQLSDSQYLTPFLQRSMLQSSPLPMIESSISDHESEGRGRKRKLIPDE